MNMTWLRRPVLLGAAALVIAAGGTAVAVAGTAASGPVYRGCLHAATGVLYNVRVNPAAAPACHRHDTVVTWNQAGARGPAGPAGPAGVPALSSMYWKHATLSLSPFGTLDEKLSCNGQDNVYNGGEWIQSASSFAVGSVWVVANGPSSDLTSWHVRVINWDATSYTVDVYTLCGPGNLPSIN